MIQRIDTYQDSRFSETVLRQHGAYLIKDEPYEVEITSRAEAVVRGKDPDNYLALIEEFRFYAPHIVKFFDSEENIIAEYPHPETICVEMNRIQPSQFFVDEQKLDAVRTFIHRPEDIVVQVIPYDSRFISLDGHTRLYLAAQRNYPSVRAVLSETDDWVWPFVREAERREVLRPSDLMLLSHDQFEIQWNQYCDRVFSEEIPEVPEKKE